jgi:hypothetical protein
VRIVESKGRQSHGVEAKEGEGGEGQTVVSVHVI